ncbi:class I SAM-dependent methyltransferase [Salidesulfovibrio brasiliensis]|uniref:class I SAM-dependent methyltransferase n=1 Tax=Salidesulfovibrio brasiliensis TaxID=221711 RepID=UPI000A44BD65|nr:class I SAM-dependent methyltransferase [Salidesulfovibrio brasiliensis]
MTAIDPYRRYWNEQGATRTFTTPFDLDLFTRYVSPDSSVLDYGCGYGRTVQALAEAGYNDVIGVDISHALVQRGLAEHPSLDLRHLPEDTIPIPDQTFDGVLMLGILTCIPSTSDQAQCLREVLRVMKPGAYLYLNDFLLNNDRRNLDRYAEGQRKYRVYGMFDIKDGGTFRHHNLEHITSLLGDMDLLHVEETVFETMQGHISNGCRVLARKK